MDSLVTAFAPAFACGLALQRLLEIADPLVETVASGSKKLIIAFVSVLVGAAFAASANLRVLERLGVADKEAIDFVVTALLVSAGTDGFNSLFKFLGYAKEATKATAVSATAAAQAAQPGGAALLQKQV